MHNALSLPFTSSQHNDRAYEEDPDLITLTNGVFQPQLIFFLYEHRHRPDPDRPDPDAQGDC